MINQSNIRMIQVNISFKFKIDKKVKTIDSILKLDIILIYFSIKSIINTTNSLQTNVFFKIKYLYKRLKQLFFSAFIKNMGKTS